MKQPSEATKIKILEFFMRTSVPRILAEERKKEKGGMEIEKDIKSRCVSETG